MSESTARAAWRAITVMAVLALMFGSAAATASAQTTPTADDRPNKWGPFIDLDGTLGTQRNIGEGDLFLPFAQSSDTLLFGDIRGRFDDRGSSEGNFGLGVRHMLASGWNLGAYGYFDRRNTAYGNDFNQATFGAEALSLDWDFRANVYQPVGDRVKDVDSLNTATISGTNVTFRGGEEVAMKGFDAEIGWRVPVFDADGLTQLRLYGGGYRFTADNVDSVQGPRARLELTIDDVPYLWQGSRLVLGAEIQHDSPRGTQKFAMLSLRVPLEIFGATETHRSSLTPMERRMTDAVVRDVDIVSQAGAFGSPETVTQTADGTTFTVIDSGSTSGGNLNTALTTAGANSTVILSGTFNTTATTTLQSGQTVMGASTVTVKAPSGRTATLTVAPATIAGATAGGASNPAVDMANDSTLSGVTVTNTVPGTAAAIAVRVNNGVTGATVSNSTITATQTGNQSAIGLQILNSSSGITVSGNTISAVGQPGSTNSGLNILSSSLTVTGNALSATGGLDNRAVSVLSTTIGAGSTGNTKVGACFNSGGNTGFIGFTDGTTCP